MIDLYQELSNAARALDQRGIPYALVGGLAYSVWVESRATEDIDLMIRPADWSAAIGALEEIGYQALAAPEEFNGVRLRRMTKLSENEALALDVLLVDPPYAEGIDTARALEFQGARIRVATPQSLILLKKNRLSDIDQNDIRGLEKLLDGNR